jgi:hypothetical protein
MDTSFQINCNRIQSDQSDRSEPSDRFDHLN